MLHGPIRNKIPRFALPVAATAILEQLFNASDIAVVGNFTGAEHTAAVAAVGANSSIIGLIVNLFIGIALGANVVIAHVIGHGGRETVTKAVHTSILVSVLGGTMAALLYRQLRRAAMDIHLEPKQLRIDLTILRRILRIGLPAGIQSAVFAISNIVIQSAVNSPGTVVMLSHSFSLLYDVMSGYLRGFGISLVPALLTILGVCGIRIAWIQFVFPQSRTFQAIMAAYPISLSVTALLIFAALLYYRRPGGLPCRKKANVPPTPGLRKGPCFALCTP